VYFFAKSFFMYFVVIWVRSTFPRIRVDHLLQINWKFFTPLALGALVVTSLVSMVMNEYFSTASVAVRTLALLAANLGLVWLVFELIRRSAKLTRMAMEGHLESGHDDHDAHDAHGGHDEHPVAAEHAPAEHAAAH
jgi:NADH-quinone oxidoreductase subunit H